MPEPEGGDSAAGSNTGALASDAELWRALSGGSDAFLILDPGGTISWINQSLPAFAEQPLFGRSVLSLLSDDQRPVLETLLERLRTGAPEEALAFEFLAPPSSLAFECRFTPIRRDGKLSAILVHARDVTAQRIAQAALSASEEKFRAIIETSPDAICLFDELGVIRYANPAAHNVLGRDAATLFGVDGWQLIHPDDRPLLAKIQEEIHARPGESIDVPRWRVLHQDGSWRWIENVATNLLGLPSVAAVVGTYRDITARVELEEQLRQAQKMEAIGLLAGGIAHDFNNLLTVALASVDHARQLLPAAHPALDDLSNIDRVSRSAAELTQKLLTFARRRVRMRGRFDLRQTVLGFSALLRRMVEESVSIEIEASEALPIDGDQGQLQQLLLNLVTNSKQAMPNGGTLRLVARRLEATSSDSFGRARLEVFDTGIGMDETTRAKLFEPFFTTRLGGTGLGMSVVANVVQDHRGSIGVDSEPGRGTTVWVELPLCADVDTTTRSGRHVSTGGTETLLLVEDEILIRDVLLRSLRDLGYRLFSAGDGEEALRILEREKIDLVVMDLVMPRMGGREALERMRALRPDLCAVLITGYTPESAEIGELTVPGRVALLHKPFLSSELDAQIRDLLDPS